MYKPKNKDEAVGISVVIVAIILAIVVCAFGVYLLSQPVHAASIDNSPELCGQSVKNARERLGEVVEFGNDVDGVIAMFYKDLSFVCHQPELLTIEVKFIWKYEDDGQLICKTEKVRVMHWIDYAGRDHQSVLDYQVISEEPCREA